ncbi:YjdF family protein [Paenibacillus filicis]|uniref:YjdF family protein n=1 Tax=Paenibacillus filicis TaxID=669464 RepID=A0ABU9DNQ4_9BACL
MKLTVFWEGEFWVGVAEMESGGRYHAVRHIFGQEPHDAEVLEFIDRDLLPLFARMSSSLDAPDLREHCRINPKRLARQAAKEMNRTGIHSMAKQALALELEHRKKTRRTVSREQKEAEQARKRELAVQKAKAKHRGR